MTVDKAALRALADTLNGILLPEGYNRQALKDAAVALPALLAENDALRAELQAHRDFLPALQYELGLVLTDDDTELSPGAHRALLWADQQISRALATPPAPPQGDGA